MKRGISLGGVPTSRRPARRRSPQTSSDPLTLMEVFTRLDNALGMIGITSSEAVRSFEDFERMMVEAEAEPPYVVRW